MSKQAESNLRLLFNTQYGSILTNGGFHLLDNKFIRVVPGVCLLTISFLLTYNDCYTEIMVLPFCARFSTETVTAKHGGVRVDRFSKERYPKQSTYLDKSSRKERKKQSFTRQLLTFQDIFLQPFVSIANYTDLLSLYETTLNIPGADDKESRAYLYMLFDDFSKAGSVVDEILLGYIKDYNILQDYFSSYMKMSAKKSKTAEKLYDMMGIRLEGIKETMEYWESIRCDIANEDYIPLKEIVNSNIRSAELFCRKQFPCFYV